MMDHLSSTTLMCAILLLFYASGTVKAAIAPGITCTDGGAADQCVANAECKADGSTFKCACTSGFYKNGDACPARIAPGIACTDGGASDQCVANAECKADGSTFKCACKSAFDKSSTACNARSDAATIMPAHMYVSIFGTVASLYFLV